LVPKCLKRLGILHKAPCPGSTAADSPHEADCDCTMTLEVISVYLYPKVYMNARSVIVAKLTGIDAKLALKDSVGCL